MGRLDGGVLKDKVYAFVEQILLMLKDHPLDKRDIVTIELIKQLVRSSASIGANLSEAEVAISDKEFRRILGIVIRETNESLYRIHMLQVIGYQIPDQFTTQGVEILKILKTIIGKIKSK